MDDISSGNLATYRLVFLDGSAWWFRHSSRFSGRIASGVTKAALADLCALLLLPDQVLWVAKAWKFLHMVTAYVA